MAGSWQRLVLIINGLRRNMCILTIAGTSDRSAATNSLRFLRALAGSSSITLGSRLFTSLDHLVGVGLAQLCQLFTKFDSRSLELFLFFFIEVVLLIVIA